jgi:hypothetical protein
MYVIREKMFRLAEDSDIANETGEPVLRVECKIMSPHKRLILRDPGGREVYTSGLTVLGDTGGIMADEDTPPNPIRFSAWRPALGLRADAVALDQHVSIGRAQRLLGWVPDSPSALEELEHGSYTHSEGPAEPVVPGDQQIFPSGILAGCTARLRSVISP